MSDGLEERYNQPTTSAPAGDTLHNNQPTNQPNEETMNNKLLLIQLAFVGKDKWHGKEYKISMCLSTHGEQLLIRCDTEPNDFRWILYFNQFNNKYHVETIDGDRLEPMSDGIVALSRWIALIKAEKYGFNN